MSLDWIDTVWSSPANRPAPEQLERLARELAGQVGKKARRLAMVLVVGGAVLASLSALLVHRLVTAPGGGEDWALAPLLAPAWLAFALVLRRALRHRAEHPAGVGPLSAVIRAAESETRMARTRVRTIAILHLVSVPALALGVRHLVDTGWVRPHELTSLSGVLAGLVLASLVGLFFYDRRELGPRQRHLRALVESYDGEAAP